MSETHDPIEGDEINNGYGGDILAELRRLSEHRGYDDQYLASSAESFGASDNLNHSSILKVRNIDRGPGWKVFLTACFRFMQMLSGFLYFGITYFYDRGRWWDSAQRLQARARRLHYLMAEWMGGAMIKIGQQLSLRYDLLPVVYCEELSRLLDEVPPFKIERARRIIEKQIGRKLDEVFIEGRLELIGSASIACVYKATLWSGNEVAVKVRRPGIVGKFVADLKALGWTMRFLEFLSFFGYGVTRNLREELTELLIEELNFRMEIRYQELFKQNCDKHPELKVTAPEVYYAYSGEEVIVSEFIRGVRVIDILRAIERSEQHNLEKIATYGVNPKEIAKRLIKMSFYGLFEFPFFHGDPHPANIFVQENNKIVMVDFGACGVFSSRERDSIHEMHYFYAKDDVGGMVRALLTLMEPLPPMDVKEFLRELEGKWWIEYYGVKSKHPEWWERTSMGLWLSLLTLGRKYRLPFPSRMLRMIRATLLYDTVAARLYRRIDVFQEYRDYYEEKAREAKWRLKQKVIEQLVPGLDNEKYKRIENLIELGENLVFKLQKIITRPSPSFAAITNKINDAIRMMLQWAGNFLIITGAIFGLAYMTDTRNEVRMADFFNPFAYLDESNSFHVVLKFIWTVLVGLFTLSFIIRIYHRLGDKDRFLRS